jgi:hypothetical protein
MVALLAGYCVSIKCLWLGWRSKGLRLRLSHRSGGGYGYSGQGLAD